MATSNPFFNPYKEALIATGQNVGNFFMHPSLQSQRAAQVAQDMFKEYAAAQQPNSVMQPYMRPGVDPDALTPEQIELLNKKGLLGQ